MPDAVSLLFLLGLVLAGGAPLLAAARRQRGLRHAAASADVSRLAQYLPRAVRVLANYLDVLVVRTNSPLSEVQDLAAQGRMAVVNAMSANEHPTQAVPIW